jgi:hypothetical protein
MAVCARCNENVVRPNKERCSTGTISKQSVVDVPACSIPCVRCKENAVLSNKNGALLAQSVYRVSQIFQLVERCNQTYDNRNSKH